MATMITLIVVPRHSIKNRSIIKYALHFTKQTELKIVLALTNLVASSASSSCQFYF